MTPASEETIEAPVARRVSRAGRASGVALLAIVVAMGAAWIERKPIASHIVDRTLAKAGVPASYRIDDLGLGRQRLTDVVIGDPAHPDLVADWVEVRTALGFHGAHVTGLSAGHVRLRGRLVDGRLSLGAIDRLLPPPSGKPFALPHLDIAVDDGRMRLETPAGVVGLKLSGSGVLDDGFSGHLAAVSERLAIGPCTASRVAATVAIAIADARPHVAGPVRAAEVDCGETRLRRASADLDAVLDERLDRWQGGAKLALGEADTAEGRLRDLGGTVSFDGSAQRTGGSLDLRAGGFAAAGLTGGALHLVGAYRLEPPFVGFQGRASADHAALERAAIARIAALGTAGEGTPLGPLAAKLAKAGAAAARSMSIDADIIALQSKRGGRIGVSRLMLDTASGAHASLSGGDGIIYDWPDSGVRVDGLLALSGGGLPEAAIRLTQPRAGAPVTGNAIVRPYRAGGARLALAPVRFTASPSGATRFSTTLTLSGPIGSDGRLEGGRLAIDGRWDGHARVAIDPQCADAGFDRLVVSGLALDKTAARLCPSGRALLAIDGSGVTGGARIAKTHLSGRLGTSPLTLDIAGGTLALADRRFALDTVAARLGPAGHQTRLDVATLDGTIGGNGVSGTFSGGGGQIANVPLVMSAAAGDWRFAGGVLDVTGGLTVADAAEKPRFNPLVSHDVALRLANNVITATGTLANPTAGVKVTDVTLAHDLGSGAGHADLAVPGIAFGKDFQPDALTPLTFGVIADVKGSVSGEGHIAWSREGVTSTGTFSTKDADLAAAFGPVTGLSTTIHFTDLLNMVSAPDQVATVDQINPGVAVENGTVHYRTLSSTEVKVDGARWPFSGGELTLDPTLLDFSEGKARRLTFRVNGMDAGQFIQKFDFKNIDATGTFDGVLPMVFDADGGRIDNGHLTVRHGGGTIAYVGEVTQKDLGTWGNMAFQALKSLRYDSLEITLDGPIAGEMVTQVRFAGVHQGAGTHANFLVKRLMKLPFVFNVTIRAPFRQLIGSAQSFYDPSKLPVDKLRTLIDEERQQKTPATPGKPAIQPPESETVP
ncbi:MAG TPA: YdbH domain-containing protein [Sphingomonas sp.]|nr:YdbH domain-containing protein [Sphingomonas sp.]